MLAFWTWCPNVKKGNNMKSILSLGFALVVGMAVATGCSKSNQTEPAARPLSPQTAEQAAKPATPVAAPAAPAVKPTAK